MIKQLNKLNIGITGPMPGFQHCDGMWFDEAHHLTYRPLAEAILNRFKPQSILELGCGAGSLAFHLRSLDSKLNVVTIDGNPDTAKSPFIKEGFHFILRTDQVFTLLDSLGLKKFDLIISFEHFEHIQPDHFPLLVANIFLHLKPGGFLMATAATWKYANDVHCNVKSHSEWVTDFQTCGFEQLPGFLNKEIIPFNFKMEHTSELIFSLKP